MRFGSVYPQQHPRFYGGDTPVLVVPPSESPENSGSATPPSQGAVFFKMVVFSVTVSVVSNLILDYLRKNR